MKKTFMNLWLRAFTLMTLMLTTSLVVNASYYLRGDYSNGAPGWSDDSYVFQDGEPNSNEVWVDRTVEAGFMFKIVNQYSGNTVWIGGSQTESDPLTFQLTENGGDNMTIANAGTYRFTYNFQTHVLVVTELSDPCPVVVKSGLTNGTVTVDKAQARAGETVTITVTPADGYYAENADITAECTIAPGNSNAPRRAPGPEVGQKLTISGDALATNSEPGTYTFVMPDYPLGVEVSAEFHECTTIAADMFNAIGDQSWTGRQVTPGVYPTEASGLTSDDYNLVYGENVNGSGYVTIHGKGKYTGTVTLNFNIVRPNLYLIGSFNNWNQEEGLLEFVEQQDGTFKVEVTNWPANSKFKLVDNQSVKVWYGADQQGGNYELDQTKIGQPLALKTADGSADFLLPVPGDWTFTVSADWRTLTVTGTWKYAINTYVSDGVGGTVTATPNPAAAGAEVTLTVTPADGYELANMTVRTVGDNPTDITVTDNTFTMPESAVDVWAYFTKIPTMTLRYSTDNWATTTDVPFTKDATGKWTLSKSDGLWPAGMSFKVIDQDGAWYGAGEPVDGDNHDYWLTRGMIGNEQAMYTAGNAKNFYLPVTGNWTFTVIPGSPYYHLIVSGDWDHAINITAPAELGVIAQVNHASIGGADELVTETRAAAGETVYVNCTTVPADASVTVHVYDANSTEIEYHPETSTFTMPYSDVNVTVTYEYVTYSIALEDVAGNQGYTLTTDQQNNDEVRAGTEVTVTVTPRNANDFAAVGLVITPDVTTTPAVDVTDNGDGTYTFTMPASNIEISATVEAKLHGVLFDDNRHWATYYGQYTLNAPEGVTVYIPTGVNGDVMEVVPFDYIPSEWAVLLYSETPMSNITTTVRVNDSGLGDIPRSILSGVLEDTGILAGEYVLYNDVFVRSEAGTLPAHRAHLHLPDAAGAPRMLKIALPTEGDTLTGVEGIDASQVASVKYVNLSGMTSDKPFKGVNVVVVTRTDGSTHTTKAVF